MSDILRNALIGKLVLLYPNDTYKKVVEVIEITELGILFKVVKAQKEDRYPIGSVQFLGNKPYILRLLSEDEVNKCLESL